MAERFPEKIEIALDIRIAIRPVGPDVVAREVLFNPAHIIKHGESCIFDREGVLLYYDLWCLPEKEGMEMADHRYEYEVNAQTYKKTKPACLIAQGHTGIPLQRYE